MTEGAGSPAVSHMSICGMATNDIMLILKIIIQATDEKDKRT